MTKCAVCEMPVEEDEMPVSAAYNGKKYYFCSTGCREEFEFNQEKYIKNLNLDEEEDADGSEEMMSNEDDEDTMDDESSPI